MPKSSMTTSRKTLKKVIVPGKTSSVSELDAWILKIGGRAITPRPEKENLQGSEMGQDPRGIRAGLI
jgi:hypothetical protein